jgi:hypothetical protein
MEIADTLAYLTGNWRLERVIADHQSGDDGLFRGHGEVQAAGDEGAYDERGVLRLGAHQGRARRTLQLARAPRGVVAVRFVDGQPFFDLDLLSGECVAVHPCREDRYRIEFEVVSDSLLRERWRVTGPLKNYTAQTTWQRC